SLAGRQRVRCAGELRRGARTHPGPGDPRRHLEQDRRAGRRTHLGRRRTALRTSYDPRAVMVATRVFRRGLAPLCLVCTLLIGACGGIPRPDDGIESSTVALDTIDERLQNVADVRIATKADYYDLDEGKRVVGREVSISAL